MHSLLVLASLTSLALARPGSSVWDVASRVAAFCPKITVSAIRGVGPGCNPSQSNSNINLDGTIATMLFGQFVTDISKPSLNCTTYLDLAYPLPVPAGCPNTGSLTARRIGRNVLAAGDRSVRVEKIAYPRGPNAGYFVSSSDQTFTLSQTVSQGLQSPPDYVELAVTPFTFAAAPNGGPGGSSPPKHSHHVGVLST